MWLSAGEVVLKQTCHPVHVRQASWCDEGLYTGTPELHISLPVGAHQWELYYHHDAAPQGCDQQAVRGVLSSDGSDQRARGCVQHLARLPLGIQAFKDIASSHSLLLVIGQVVACRMSQRHPTHHCQSGVALYTH
ncbi:hypothetical protein E2C01_047954 [Portunus trituberculatus]|uniref:Uncharacterized protein n=1 Tax=Portunus trituberculatus TaxID=210409 RepID=A0A5B7G946_PORTR|nr:hypothetical protein [Portunus trituberculatus]